MNPSILSELYKLTLTPQITEDYLSNTNLKTLIEYVHKSLSKIQGYFDVTDDEIRDVICFILKLVNTPIDLKGSLLVEPSIIYLIEKALDEQNVQVDQKNKIMAIEKEWFESLRQSPYKKFYIKKPHIEDFPLMLFHIESYEYSSSSLYKVYAYFIHKCIRINEGQKIASGTHKSYIRSARYFFIYNVGLPEYHPPQIPATYIKNFVRVYNKERYGTSRPLSSTSWDYFKMFIKLLRTDKIKPRPRLKGIISGVSEENFFSPAYSGVEILNPEEDAMPTLRSVGLTNDTVDEKDECSDFEYVPDLVYDYIAIDEEQEVVPKKPTLSRNWQDIVNLRSFHFWWDSNYLNLFHYSAIYKILNELWGHSSFYNSIITFLYLSIHTGIDSRKLIHLSISDNDTRNSMPELKKIGDRYYILNQSIVNMKKTDDGAGHLNTSRKIYIPLPDMICRMVDNILSDDIHIFTYISKNKKRVKLNLTDIDEFIQKKIIAPYSQYNLKITLPKISASFIPLYSHRYGLDPIICCHISGEDRYRIYRSQMHYIYVPQSMLEQQYLKAFKLVNLGIWKNLSHCIKEGYISIKNTSHVNSGNSFIKNNLSLGYGSTIACNEDFVADIIKNLKSAIINERDYIKRHNLYVIYIFFGLQFSIGLRPRNNPEIKWRGIDFKIDVIVIRDKQSAKYHEERVLPLAKIIRVLLHNILDGFGKLQSYIGKYIYPSVFAEKADKVFFFINIDGQFEDFTLKKAKEYLKDVGIDYSLPLNMPRHYMRNHLYHAGLINDMADIWMGHQHAGREMLNITSSAIMSDVIAECIPKIESMLEKIGFANIKYLP